MNPIKIFVYLLGIPSYDINLDYRLECTFVPFETPMKFEMATMIGTTEEETSYGKVEFELNSEVLFLV